MRKQSKHSRQTMLAMTENSSIDSRSLGPGGVQFRLSSVGSGPSEDATEARKSTLCTLNSHCFAHNGAATGKNLQIGHGASAGRNVASGRGQRAKSSGRCFAQEGAHGAGLTEKSLHSDGFRQIEILLRFCLTGWFEELVSRQRRRRCRLKDFPTPSFQLESLHDEMRFPTRRLTPIKE